ncbi:MAG: hypothetical protein HGN29_13385 [Asgard group archaeon]|nr:hypothetical protein [Asgard group archaeon]
MEEHTSIVRGIDMGKSFQFYCMECEINLILYEGIKKSPSIACVNFFCFNCNKISHHNQCIECGDILLYTIKIPQEQKQKRTEEENHLAIKLRCPKCESNNTLLTLLGEWEHQIG